jgi:hypothetical protein
VYTALISVYLTVWSTVYTALNQVGRPAVRGRRRTLRADCRCSIAAEWAAPARGCEGAGGDVQVRARVADGGPASVDSISPRPWPACLYCDAILYSQVRARVADGGPVAAAGDVRHGARQRRVGLHSRPRPQGRRPPHTHAGLPPCLVAAS